VRTHWDGFVFIPIIDDIVPLEVSSESIDGGELGLLGSEKEAMMLEANDIVLLGVPSITEFSCTRRSAEPNSVRPKVDNTLIICNFDQSKK